MYDFHSATEEKNGQEDDSADGRGTGGSERVPCCDRESDDLFLDSVYGHCGNFDDRIYLWML